MIAWLQPAALWGLALLAIPIAIHLLRPRHAQRVRFPSIRFVQPSRTAAVRFRPPSDLVLLALRLAIVALASLAAAQPIWLSSGRLSAWNARTARAIVVDSSESMKTPRPDNRTAFDEARAAAEDEAASGPTILIEHADLREGLQRAVAWLDSAPPARREIVVISDFQHGALPAASVGRIDSATGLRFVRVGGVSGRSVDGIPLLQAPGVDGRAQRVEVTPDATELRLERGSDVPAAARGSPAGLRFVGAQAEGERLLAALASAGTPAPNPERPMVIVFTTGAPAGGDNSFEPWMIETVARVERDAELHALGREATGVEVETSDGWTVILADRGGRPLVSASAANEELFLQCAAPAASYFSAALVRTALEGNYGPVGRPELEVLATPETTLSAWTRPAGPVDASVWRRADESDARWLWAAALVLLAVESVLRARTNAPKEEACAAA